jgi:uncharacterized protein (TIGR03435 family)
LALAYALSAGVGAHDIPTVVRIQVYLKPEPGRLRLVVRAPVSAMNELEWPARGLFLDLPRVEPVVREAAEKWIAGRIDLFEEDQRLGPPALAGAVISLPSDTSFDAYESALARATGPMLPADTEVVANQVMLDAVLDYPLRSEASPLSIDARFGTAALRSTTTLRLLPPGAPERAFQLHGEEGLVRLDPRWMQAAARFVRDGFFHILDGTDHLLFLVCLVIPFRRLKTLVIIVTSFTLAHSVTLIASAYDMAPSAGWFPPLVETLIAASIVYMAFENIVAPHLTRRWAVAFGFGLVHGFGFSFALRDALQFAGSHLLTSLVAFNVGVELGQLLVLVVVVPLVGLLFRRVIDERPGTILLSAVVAHTAWHWMTERGATFLTYPLTMPALDAAFVAAALRWAIVGVVLAALAWAISVLFGRLTVNALLMIVGVGSTTVVGQGVATGTFEVASVKANPSRMGIRGHSFPGDRFEARNVPLSDLILVAYGEPGQLLPPSRLWGAPAWINRERFDVSAKLKGESKNTIAEKQLALRQLLAARFGLSAHVEERVLPAYRMTVSRKDMRLGPGLRRSDMTCEELLAAQPGPREQCVMAALPTGELEMRGQAMSSLANVLTLLLGRMVVDNTGLTGGFDGDATFSPHGLPGMSTANAPTVAADDAPTLTTALEDQLGLKLESVRAPVRGVVIDRVDRPTEN